MALQAKREKVRNVKVTAPILVRGEHTVPGTVLETSERGDGDLGITEDQAKDIVGAGRGEFTDDKPGRPSEPKKVKAE